MKWKTRDGREIEISKMSDGHLLNTIKFLERNAEKYRMAMAYQTDVYSTMTNGEMASLCLEQDAFQMYEMSGDDWLETYCPEYNEMIDEQLKRGLL